MPLCSSDRDVWSAGIRVNKWWWHAKPLVRLFMHSSPTAIIQYVEKQILFFFLFSLLFLLSIISIDTVDRHRRTYVYIYSHTHTHRRTSIASSDGRHQPLVHMCLLQVAKIICLLILTVRFVFSLSLSPHSSVVQHLHLNQMTTRERERERGLLRVEK